MNKEIYIGNLSFSASEEEVEELFARYGAVHSAELMTDQQGRSRGFAFVEMEAEEADRAMLGLDGKRFKGRNLIVDEARGLRSDE